MGYRSPHGEDMYVSCSQPCHIDRNPPSSEPGTDYGCAYGSAVYAADPGRISDLKSSNSSATGRYVTLDLDDGRRVRYLHLSRITVSVGNRVSRGQKIAESGASGYGSDWYYGAHDHTTLWDCWCYNFCSSCTLNFEKYVGSSNPPEDDMKVSSFKKDLGLDTAGTQTIRDGQSEYLLVTKNPVNTKIATGPNSYITAVIGITFAEGLTVAPWLEAVQVEPVVSERQKDGSLKDTSLGRQEVRGTPGLTRVKVPVSTRLDSADKYLRVKVYAPAGVGDVIVQACTVRGGEFTN